VEADKCKIGVEVGADNPRESCARVLDYIRDELSAV
jgi:hypothetical protein